MFSSIKQNQNVPSGVLVRMTTEFPFVQRHTVHGDFCASNLWSQEPMPFFPEQLKKNLVAIFRSNNKLSVMTSASANVLPTEISSDNNQGTMPESSPTL